MPILMESGFMVSLFSLKEQQSVWKSNTDCPMTSWFTQSDWAPMNPGGCYYDQPSIRLEAQSDDSFEADDVRLIGNLTQILRIFKNDLSSGGLCLFVCADLVIKRDSIQLRFAVTVQHANTALTLPPFDDFLSCKSCLFVAFQLNSQEPRPTWQLLHRPLFWDVFKGTMTRFFVCIMKTVQQMNTTL